MGKFIKGVSVQHFLSGWWGEHNNGKELLQELGLPTDELPFDVERFLERGTVEFKDSMGENISVCYKKHDTHFEFGCIYHNKRRAFRLFREWESESLDAIIQLESYSIGDCIRQIISGKSIV